MGADKAVRIEEPAPQDGRLLAKILAQTLRDQSFDLILTGVQAEDDGFGQVGVSLAQLLGLSHAAIVNKIEITGDRALVKRELEGGIEESVELKLPAVLTIQTGINEPKYVSLAAILEAEDKEMTEVPLEKIGLTLNEPIEGTVEQVFFPPVGKMAEILKGNPEEVVGKLTEIIQKKKG
jgi:electron transfer flavoprotein beta subunit